MPHTRALESALFALALTAAALVGPADATAQEPRTADASATAERRLEAWQSQEARNQASPFRGMHWQALGPRNQGGRVETIDAVPGTATIWVGFGAGNVWKTDNDGLTWTPVFEHEPTFTIGDLDISDSNPNVVYVGTGENLLARSSFAGLGVFKTVDGGTTWTNVGLGDTQHIARVAVDPTNPDIVFVAALGHEYSANPERGVFRTKDGGRTWEKVLYVNERVGAVDVVLDPTDPDIVYAATNEHVRRAWNNRESGEGSGVWKSTDGGSTWARLKNGLPAGPAIGRIGLAVAPSDPKVVYAFLSNGTRVVVQTEKGPDTTRAGPEVYRSDDAGGSWRKLAMANDSMGMGFYGDIAVAPNDPDVFYALGQNVMASRDGGATFRNLHGTVVHLYRHPSRALHLDQHDIWVDPTDPDRILLGNDGGLYRTEDGGQTWLHVNNLPVGEFYAVALDDADPYHVYGGTQDNAAHVGRADRLPEDGIDDAWRYVWIDLWGGGDSFVTRPDPTDPDVVYFEQQFGDFQRKDLSTGEITHIKPKAEDGQPALRYNWMSPFIVSHHNPLTLYFGADRLFKSLDRGDSWRPVSGDLSTGPGPEHRGNVPFGTITTVSESPLQPGLLYVGTDDGRLWVTRNDGVDWTDIGGDLPDLWVSRVEASGHHLGTVYATLTGYRNDDFRAYAWRSDDFGATWTSIAGGLPDQQLNVVREDPVVDGLVYLGSDQGGVWVSRDRGATWTALMADLPTAAVHDIAIQPREREMVIATHGRSLFKLDLDPVQLWSDSVAAAPLHLFPVRAARLPRRRDYGGDWAYETGRDLVVHFALAEAGPAEVRVVDGGGKTVWSRKIEGAAGVNRVTWDLKTGGEYGPERPNLHRGVRLLDAGDYTVEVEAAGVTVEKPLVVERPEPITVGTRVPGR